MRNAARISLSMSKGNLFTRQFTRFRLKIALTFENTASIGFVSGLYRELKIGDILSFSYQDFTEFALCTLSRSMKSEIERLPCYVRSALK